ncbi:MAG TPA: cytochrome P450 [Acidimicrobiales bacterium]|nr:cytochrome P450 [Acidimicrobiales bacterium]
MTATPATEDQVRWRDQPDVVDPMVLVDAAGYGRDGYPHQAWKTLRAESPVHWCHPDGYRPFWALTRHDDIRYVSTHPEQFESAPRTILFSEQMELISGAMQPRTLINLDPPEHRDYRAVAAPFLKPSAIRSLEGTIRAITVDLLDRNQRSDRFDFVFDLAAYHPLKVICRVLGAAADDEDLVLRIANTVFGLEDPDYGPQLAGLAWEMMEYYRRLKEDRLARPTEDLYSALVHARIGDQPMGDIELVSYFLILTSAGHDTTRNAIGGGLLALLEHPEQLAALRDDPSRCATAADEIIRWTSPVIQFCRTPVEDVELRGRTIRAGETLAMFYPSANRDEAVFEQADRFQVSRDPNPHLGLGVGEHYCLGASLARTEIRILLEELVPRLDHVELAGAVERTVAAFVGGVKHLPIRWTLRPSSRT